MASDSARAAASADKITKAALSMLTVQDAQSLAEQGLIFMFISPEWVKTDLGNKKADLTPEKSAIFVFDLLVSATIAYNWNSTIFVWTGGTITMEPRCRAR
ncbi:uncharacterized protein BO97DRAFT_427447 [Aspergillus homomorphus CBS 101889]|uniref:Uncharacterized protein n=1 Tax=Aspergillus homomorphus (strain CBS 101889) TaxID=1450537 RepID=A0A395HNQ4_ASPHC|nr:hypothetical protein BO97DRAFT_427447 [Aspergillus homomorphus CBS 101889]RAL09390.1 hypothetical protein BO97DRAFT_427447 [Aspergillus homomorphus CBS 101889]